MQSKTVPRNPKIVSIQTKTVSIQAKTVLIQAKTVLIQAKIVPKVVKRKVLFPLLKVYRVRGFISPNHSLKFTLEIHSVSTVE